MQNSNVEDTYFPSKSTLLMRDKLLDLSTPRVMGIVNTTPDSFYSNSRETDTKFALKKIEQFINEGATFIDIGGYSSRPGAKEVSEEIEIERIREVINQASKEFPEVFISIDTFRSTVAQIAIDHGACMINDISGFNFDPEIAIVAAKNKVPYILMHVNGSFETMHENTEYTSIYSEICTYFSRKIEELKKQGVHDIILDPGFGFSKTIDQNHHLLSHLESFKFFGLPILAGLSRKSMIYKKLNCSPEEALNGTIALNAIALSKGASILRVHDVKEAVDLIRLLQ
jgi:dihydropteroate synthase